MPVRVKLRITSEHGGRSIVTSAYVNSGYEADQPELLIPITLAEELGIWGKATEEYARTPIGIGRIYVLCRKAKVEIVAEDRSSSPIDVCIVVSEYEREVLISDYLASELKIAVEDFREGLWRFRDEPLDMVRKSEKPQYWY